MFSFIVLRPATILDKYFKVNEPVEAIQDEATADDDDVDAQAELDSFMAERNSPKYLRWAQNALAEPGNRSDEGPLQFYLDFGTKLEVPEYTSSIIIKLTKSNWF